MKPKHVNSSRPQANSLQFRGRGKVQVMMLLRVRAIQKKYQTTPSRLLKSLTM